MWVRKLEWRMSWWGRQNKNLERESGLGGSCSSGAQWERVALGDGLGWRGWWANINPKWKNQRLGYHWEGGIFSPGSSVGLVWGMEDQIISVFRQVAVGPTGSLLIPGIYRLACPLLKGNSHFSYGKAAFEMLSLWIPIWPSRRGVVMCPLYYPGSLLPQRLNRDTSVIYLQVTSGCSLSFCFSRRWVGVRTGKGGHLVSLFRIARIPQNDGSDLLPSSLPQG